MPVIFCRKCQGLVEEGQPFCPRCYTPVKRPALLRRVFERFADWCGGFSDSVDGGPQVRRSPVTTTNITVRKGENFTLHEQTTKEVREFSNINDLPAEMRAMVEAAMRSDGSPGRTTEQSIVKHITTGPDGVQRQEITVRGKDGVERRYSSVDELPPEMRRLLDEFRRD